MLPRLIANEIDRNYDPRRTHTLFVYGTMLKGRRNHERLLQAGGEMIDIGFTRPHYQMVTRMASGGYLTPAALIGGDDAIMGELYHVDGAALERLDAAEGHPFVYAREQVTISGHKYPAWMYMFVGDLPPFSQKGIRRHPDGSVEFVGE